MVLEDARPKRGENFLFKLEEKGTMGRERAEIRQVRD